MKKPRSYWPGQHARCGVCDGLMYRYGTSLRCQHTTAGSSRSCWNHVQADITTVSAKVLSWLPTALAPHPEAQATLVNMVWTELERDRRPAVPNAPLDAVAELETQAQRLAEAIALGGPLLALVAKLADVEAALRQARAEPCSVAEPPEPTACPSEFASAADVAARLADALAYVTRSSPDFADGLRRLLPVFLIQPVQALDCGLVRPRGKLTLRMDNNRTVDQQPLEIVGTVDLFEPPVHIKHLAACVAYKRAQPKASLDTIAEELAINRMTVKRALAYGRQMEQQGLTDPYRELHACPEHASRWHKRFQSGDESVA